MNKSAWVTKSLLTGAALGFFTFGLSFGFLTIHQELGLRPSFSYKPAILVFLLAAILTGIYLHSKIKSKS